MSDAIRHGCSEQRRRGDGAPITFPLGEILYDATRGPRRIYLIRSGRARLTNGSGAIVDYLGPGDFFGEKCLMGSGSEMQIAKSLSPMTVSAFRKTDLLDLVQHDRRFALQLLKNLALRLDRYEQTIRDSVTEQAERRLARLLFRFLPRQGAHDWRRLRFSPSNSELAKTIGTTKSRVAHFMSHFQQLGWLERRPELWIHREGLRRFLTSPP